MPRAPLRHLDLNLECLLGVRSGDDQQRHDLEVPKTVIVLRGV